MGQVVAGLPCFSAGCESGGPFGFATVGLTACGYPAPKSGQVLPVLDRSQGSGKGDDCLAVLAYRNV
jgi:hypothetical protein